MRAQPHYFTPTPLLPRLGRLCYNLMFVVILIAGAYFLLVYAPSVRESGSLVPTAAHLVAQHEDGETIYITQSQHLLLNAYGAAFAMSLLVWLMVGILLEVKLKIHIFKGGSGAAAGAEIWPANLLQRELVQQVNKQ